jgi:SAM-dependent methyltransferase
MPERVHSAESFSVARLHALRKLESTHFWFVARRELIGRILARAAGPSSTILDIGCGTGLNLSVIGGIDLLIEGLKMSGRSDVAQADAARLPLLAGTVDVVIALDVLEHVDDDVVFAEVARVLKTGGSVVVTVPALGSLWSYRDKAAGHRRRYSRAALRSLAERHGFRVVDLRGFQFLLLPLVIASRLRRDGQAARDFEDAPPSWLNRMFLAVNRLELFLSGIVRPPLGSSFALLATKES